MVEFAKFTPEEQQAVEKIVDRFHVMLVPLREPMPTRADTMMDLAAVHHHTPLRLVELAEADDFNFAHDMGGIRNCLNRETGELEHCFLPRFAAPAVSDADRLVDAVFGER